MNKASEALQSIWNELATHQGHMQEKNEASNNIIVKSLQSRNSYAFWKRRLKSLVLN